MTSTTGPQSLDAPPSVPAITWWILAAAVVVVAVGNFSGGSSDERECKREARDNAAIVTAVGGEDRYVEICVTAHEKVRQIQGRKP